MVAAGLAPARERLAFVTEVLVGYQVEVTVRPDRPTPLVPNLARPGRGGDARTPRDAARRARAIPRAERAPRAARASASSARSRDAIRTRAARSRDARPVPETPPRAPVLPADRSNVSDNPEIRPTSPRAAQVRRGVRGRLPHRRPLGRGGARPDFPPSTRTPPRDPRRLARAIPRDRAPRSFPRIASRFPRPRLATDASSRERIFISTRPFPRLVVSARLGSGRLDARALPPRAYRALKPPSARPSAHLPPPPAFAVEEG